MKTAGVLLTLVVGSLMALGCSHDHIAVEQTPPAVMEGFNREFPGLTLSHTDRITMIDKQVQYELKFRDVNHDYHRKTFTADGKLLDWKGDVALPAATMPVK